MICLCCGKPMKENAKPEELINGWHNSCVRHFFGTKELRTNAQNADLPFPEYRKSCRFTCQMKRMIKCV